MGNNDAQGKALKITILYFMIGCAWILFSDKLVQFSFYRQKQVLYYSIAKGILYVLVTSILIYALIYPTLKEALDGKEALSKANAQLQKTNELYKKLKARRALDFKGTQFDPTIANIFVKKFWVSPKNLK